MSDKIVRKERVLPAYKLVDGVRIAKAFSTDAFRSALAYKPRPDDVFIVTYPKCGTTWTQAILFNIFHKGKPWSSALDFFSGTPFLEMMGAEAAIKMKRPGAIKMHLPYELTPYSPSAKYIFIARNPKDCCVSFYYHTKSFSIYEFEDGAFDDYFELFIDGKVDFNDYFDTLLSWYKHRDDDNVLFLTYENMKADIEGNILKIAEFLGPQYKKEFQQDPTLLQNLVLYSSVKYMKESMNKSMEDMLKLPKDYIRNNPDFSPGMKNMLLETDEKPEKEITFIRKGIVGDWRNHFSEEQNARMNKKFKERTKGTDIANWWADCM